MPLVRLHSTYQPHPDPLFHKLLSDTHSKLANPLLEYVLTSENRHIAAVGAAHTPLAAQLHATGRSMLAHRFEPMLCVRLQRTCAQRQQALQEAALLKAPCSESRICTTSELPIACTEVEACCARQYA